MGTDRDLIERVRAKVDRLPDATDLMFDLDDIRALLARLAEVEAERDAMRPVVEAAAEAVRGIRLIAAMGLRLRPASQDLVAAVDTYTTQEATR